MRRRIGLLDVLVAVGTLAATWAVPYSAAGQSCPDPRPAPAGPGLYIEDLNLDAPGDAVITVKLAAGGQQVAGTQNDIVFDANVRVKAKANGRPDCTVNPDINKGSTSFAFQPPGCSGEACTGLRAIVFSTEDVAAIPDGSVLYTCNVTVSGSGTLAVANARGSDPNGGAITGFTGREGNICVAGAQPPTPTPTTPPQPTATPTNTVAPPTATFTSPPPPTNTPTTRATATPSPTLTPAIIEDEGGCHVAPAGSSGLPLWLLAPLALALLRRRARR